MDTSKQLSTESLKKPFPIWLGVLISFLGGLFLSTCFVPLDLSQCVWFALLPLLIVLWTGNYSGKKRSWKINALYGWVYGIGFYAASLWWLNEVSTLAYIAASLYLGLYISLWALGMTTIFRPSFRPLPEPIADKTARWAVWKSWSYHDMFIAGRTAILGGALWVCLEWLRGWLISGFGWNGLAVSMYSLLSMIQLAEFFGTVAMSFLPVMVNIWLWFIVRRIGMMTLREGKRAVPWDFFGLVTILIGIFLAGMVLSHAYAPYNAKTTVPVMTVQLNLSQEEKWDRSNILSIYESLKAETQKGLEELEASSLQEAVLDPTGCAALKRPAWVIWPESSFPLSTWYSSDSKQLFHPDMQDNVLFLTDQQQCIGGLKKDYDFVLFSGSDHVYLDKEGKTQDVYNCLTMFTDDYQSAQAHAKVQLVPFGEYIPFRESLPFLENLFEASAGFAMGSNFSRGTSSEPLVAPVCPDQSKTVQVIPLICFEDVVGSWARQMVRPEEQVMVNVTNDGWFNQSVANEQHWRNAAMRCIELRRPMVRAANTGVSIVLGSNGEPVAELRDEEGSPFVRGYMYADVPINTTGLTVYAMFGDWAVGVCAFLLIAYSLYYYKQQAYLSPRGSTPK